MSDNDILKVGGELANREAPPPTEWAVLWVRKGSEKTVIDKLKTLLSSDVYVPFVPMLTKPIVRKRKIVDKRVELCFPGYVFVRVAASVEEFFRDVYSKPTAVDGAYRFVYYGTDKKDVFMRRKERECIERLLDEQFVMEASVGYVEGDRVKVISGPLTGRESEIKRVNRRQCTVVIETEMMGRVVETQLMLDFVKKVQ